MYMHAICVEYLRNICCHWLICVTLLIGKLGLAVRSHNSPAVVSTFSSKFTLVLCIVLIRITIECFCNICAICAIVHIATVEHCRQRYSDIKEMKLDWQTNITDKSYLTDSATVRGDVGEKVNEIKF